MTISILRNQENTDIILRILEKVHKEKNVNMKIYLCDTVRSFMINCRVKNTNLAIFNERIKGEECNGYDLAYHIRMMNNKAMPVMIADNNKIDIRAGESELFGYLTPENLETQLTDLIIYAFRRLYKECFEPLLCYQWNGAEREVNLNKVFYFCSDHRVVEFKGMDGADGIFYQRLDEVESALQDWQTKDMFVRISKSYLVNKKYILKNEGVRITMINGDRIEIPRRNRKKLEK